MRTPRLVLVALVLLVGGCGKSTPSPSTKGAPETTTTTADPVDKAAVDLLIDQVAAPTKLVLKAESGDIAGRQLSDAAAQLTAIAEGLKDPAKRPRGVPPKPVDDLGAALADTGAAAADLARAACPAGISTPRCTDLYLKLNQGQTSLISALQGLDQYDTRTPEQVQALLYA